MMIKSGRILAHPNIFLYMQLHFCVGSSLALPDYIAQLEMKEIFPID